MSFSGGKILMTASVDALPDMVKAAALQRVATFSDFSEDNDPHGEHDFGSFNLCNRTFFWKIDYYDKELQFGSEDPANPEITTRVALLAGSAPYHCELAILQYALARLRERDLDSFERGVRDIPARRLHAPSQKRAQHRERVRLLALWQGLDNFDDCFVRNRAEQFFPECWLEILVEHSLVIVLGARFFPSSTVL